MVNILNIRLYVHGSFGELSDSFRFLIRLKESFKRHGTSFLLQYPLIQVGEMQINWFVTLDWWCLCFFTN